MEGFDDIRKEYVLNFLNNLKTPEIFISMRIDSQEIKVEIKVETLIPLIKNFDINPMEYIVRYIFDEFVINSLSEEDKNNFCEIKPKVS